MRALVAYESLYGNTAAVGEAIAASLRDRGFVVDAGPVVDIDPADATEVDLLVLGGPTHIHGMSSSKTRQTAAADEKNTYPDPTVEPGLRDWVKRLAPGEGRLAASFDTRIDKSVVLTGSAAKGIRRRLEKRGFRVLPPPGSFLVSTENRLLDGEVASASSWADGLAQQAIAEALAVDGSS